MAETTFDVQGAGSVPLPNPIISPHPEPRTNPSGLTFQPSSEMGLFLPSVLPSNEPPKRKRGRPPKNKQCSNAQLGVGSNEQSKRKRGRPRKSSLQLNTGMEQSTDHGTECKQSPSPGQGTLLMDLSQHKRASVPPSVQLRENHLGPGSQLKEQSPQAKAAAVAAINNNQSSSRKSQNSQRTNASFLGMPGFSNDEEDCASISTIDDRKTRVSSYSVNSELSHTLVDILDKHGDVAKDCELESKALRNATLESILKVVQELQKYTCMNVGRKRLEQWYTVVNDAERVKINVAWLRKTLNKVSDYVKSINDFKKLVNEKKAARDAMEAINQTLEFKKVEMVKIQSDIQELEDQLAAVKPVQEILSVSINELVPDIKLLLYKSLADWLI